MLPEHDLRPRLRERRDRLYRTGPAEFERELERLVAWLESRPYVAAILREIEAAEVEYDSWLRALRRRRRFALPTTELERTKICLEICRRGDPDNLTRALTASHFENLDRVFVEAFVDPLVNFVEDRLEEGGSILVLLLRYKRRVEWFDRERLFRRATRSDDGAGLLDTHLRRFLLESGVDYPFSHPSGPPDAESRLGDDQPLALATRTFAPEAGHDLAGLRDGFGEALELAGRYERPAGYLAVFNLAPEQLAFRTSTPRGHVPSVRTGGKRVFIVPIHTNPGLSPDRRTRRNGRVEVEERFLTGELVEQA
jgi:hypothetical protein